MTKNEAATKVLLDLGVSPGLLGYRYSKAILTRAVGHPSWVTSLSDTYKVLAEEYGTKPYCIESAVRHAITRTLVPENAEKVAEYFGNALLPTGGRVTNNAFLATLLDHVENVLEAGELPQKPGKKDKRPFIYPITTKT